MIFTRKNVMIFFVLTAIFFGLSLHNRPSHVDEAQLAEHSYTLDKIGHVRSVIGTVYDESYAFRAYHYHKFLIVVGAVFDHIFGYSIYTFKFVPLFFLMLFLFFLFKYVRYIFKDDTYFYLIASIILLHTYIYFFSFTFRPEVMVMSLGFISFYNLMIGINENKTKNIIFAGILAGLSTFTHLNGAIFCVAGFLLLILNKKLKEALLFGVFAFCFSALYFWDLRTIAEIKSWYVQFRLEPIIIEKENIFMSIMHEQKRFFHSEREIVFSLMFFIGLFVNFVKFKNKSVFVGSDRDRNFLIYTILLMISLMLISANKTSKYSILYFPEMAIVIAITLMKLKDKTKLFKIFFIGLFIAYIAIHSYHDTKVLRSKLNVKLRNEQISKLIPEKHVKVIAPESFVFNQIDNYTVYGYVAFSYFYTIFYPNKPKDIYEYLLFSKSKDVKYVIIDEKQDGRNFDYKLLDSFVLNQNINGYDLIRREDGLYIFEKI